MIPRSWQSSWCGRALAISLCALIAAPLAAAETECDPEDPGKCSRPLTEGEKAPFSGQLITTRLALDLSLKAHFCQDRIDLELKFSKKTADLELSLERQLRGIDKRAWGEQKKLLITRLEEAHHRPWYESPLFVSIVTVAATVLLIWGARETLKTW